MPLLCQSLTNRCERCRRRKQKCLGMPPYSCASCNDGGHECVYTESEKRVSVPESYFMRLQSQARVHDVHGGMPSPAQTAMSEVEWTFAGTDNWVRGRQGQYRESGTRTAGRWAKGTDHQTTWAARHRRTLPTG